MTTQAFPINNNQLRTMIRNPNNKYYPKEWRNSFCSNPPQYFSPAPNTDGVRRPKLFYPFKKNSNFDYADTDYKTTEKKFTFKCKTHIEALSTENKRKANMIRTCGNKPTAMYKSMHKETLDVAKHKVIPRNRRRFNTASDHQLDSVNENKSVITNPSERPYSNFGYGNRLSSDYVRTKRNASPSPDKSIIRNSHNSSQMKSARKSEMNDTNDSPGQKAGDADGSGTKDFDQNVLDSSGNKFSLDATDNTKFIDDRFASIKNKFLDDRNSIRTTTRSNISYRIGPNKNNRLLNNKRLEYNQNLSQGERYSARKPIENIDYNENPHQVNINSWEYLQALNENKWRHQDYRIKTKAKYNMLGMRPKTGVMSSSKNRKKCLNKTMGSIDTTTDQDYSPDYNGTSNFNDKEMKIIPRHGVNKTHKGYYYEDYNAHVPRPGSGNRSYWLNTADRINQTSQYFYGAH